MKQFFTVLAVVVLAGALYWFVIRPLLTPAERPKDQVGDAIGGVVGTVGGLVQTILGIPGRILQVPGQIVGGVESVGKGIWNTAGDVVGWINPFDGGSPPASYPDKAKPIALPTLTGGYYYDARGVVHDPTGHIPTLRESVRKGMGYG